MDGGDIVFHSFDDGVVTLFMQGACAGCPSSTATLKMGIENMLRHYIPVQEVRADNVFNLGASNGNPSKTHRNFVIIIIGVVAINRITGLLGWTIF